MEVIINYLKKKPTIIFAQNGWKAGATRFYDSRMKNYSMVLTMYWIKSENNYNGKSIVAPSGAEGGAL